MKAVPIQIVVAERYPLFRLAIRQLLLPAKNSFDIHFPHDPYRMELTPERGSAAHILLLDCGLIEGDVCTHCKNLKSRYPLLRIILMREHAEGISVKKCFQQSVDGLLLKTVEPEELLTALHCVANGEPYIQHSMRLAVFDWLLPKPGRREASKLTGRELEILRLIVEEYTSREIAAQLFISTCTVETHRLNLIQKLGVKNTAGLVREAMRRNMYRPAQGWS